MPSLARARPPPRSASARAPAASPLARAANLRPRTENSVTARQGCAPSTGRTLTLPYGDARPDRLQQYASDCLSLPVDPGYRARVKVKDRPLQNHAALVSPLRSHHLASPLPPRPAYIRTRLHYRPSPFVVSSFRHCTAKVPAPVHWTASLPHPPCTQGHHKKEAVFAPSCFSLRPYPCRASRPSLALVPSRFQHCTPCPLHPVYNLRIQYKLHLPLHLLP